MAAAAATTAAARRAARSRRIWRIIAESAWAAATKTESGTLLGSGTTDEKRDVATPPATESTTRIGADGVVGVD
jgi:hypothetical protein